VGLTVPLLAVVVCVGASAGAAAAKLPLRLTDTEFWTLIADLSEPNGTFRSENLLSNEARFQFVIPDLVEGIRPGGVYMGVGPEQNFTYIAAVKPAIAFIVDVRRGNLDLHLMYKALFELSADRAEFVSRLFSRKRPAGLRHGSTAAQIFAAYAQVESSADLYQRNLRDIQRQLSSRHAFSMTADDVQGVEHVYGAFFQYGPAIQYSSNEGPGAAYQPTYADLMLATDTNGRTRSYLTTVSVFYLSNVEQYLRLQRSWNTFCANVAALPLDDMSTFVRAGHGGRVARGTAMTAELGAITAEVDNCGGR
jgi:hypothetical protein